MQQRVAAEEQLMATQDRLKRYEMNVIKIKAENVVGENNLQLACFV